MGHWLWSWEEMWAGSSPNPGWARHPTTARSPVTRPGQGHVRAEWVPAPHAWPTLAPCLSAGGGGRGWRVEKSSIPAFFPVLQGAEVKVSSQDPLPLRAVPYWLASSFSSQAETKQNKNRGLLLVNVSRVAPLEEESESAAQVSAQPFQGSGCAPCSSHQQGGHSLATKAQACCRGSVLPTSFQMVTGPASS